MKITPVKITIVSKLIVTSSLIFMIVGCTSMNSEFACPNKPGVTCRSLGQVNSMIDQGIIGKDDTTIKSSTAKTCSLCFSALSYANKATNNARPYNHEEAVRVWIAPYQDVSGNYHEASVIRAAISKDAANIPKEIVEAK